MYNFCVDYILNFKGNELITLQLNCVQMLNYSVVFLTFVLKFGI